MRREGAAVGVGNDFNGEEGRYPMSTNAGEISKEREAQKKQSRPHTFPLFSNFSPFSFFCGGISAMAHTTPRLRSSSASPRLRFDSLPPLSPSAGQQKRDDAGD